MQTETYRRKIIAVEAIQVTEETLYEIAKWCGGDVRTDYETKEKFIKISVLHPLKPEHSKAYAGNWILKSAAGYKIFNDKAFLSSWEKVDPEPKSDTPEDRLREQLNKSFSKDGAEALTFTAPTPDLEA
jgi:hypothetical protein